LLPCLAPPAWPVRWQSMGKAIAVVIAISRALHAIQPLRASCPGPSSAIAIGSAASALLCSWSAAIGTRTIWQYFSQRQQAARRRA
jgi:hypothetical protein